MHRGLFWQTAICLIQSRALYHRSSAARTETPVQVSPSLVVIFHVTLIVKYCYPAFMRVLVGYPQQSEYCHYTAAVPHSESSAVDMFSVFLGDFWNNNHANCKPTITLKSSSIRRRLCRLLLLALEPAILTFSVCRIKRARSNPCSCWSLFTNWGAEGAARLCWKRYTCGDYCQRDTWLLFSPCLGCTFRNLELVLRGGFRRFLLWFNCILHMFLETL